MILDKNVRIFLHIRKRSCATKEKRSYDDDVRGLGCRAATVDNFTKRQAGVKCRVLSASMISSTVGLTFFTIFQGIMEV